MNKYQRECPECKIILTYTRVSSRNKAEKLKQKCYHCCKFNPVFDKINGLYTKICDCCNITKMEYPDYAGLYYAIKNNVICKICRKTDTFNRNNIIYIRNCPDCNKEIKTKNKYFYNKSIKENSKCVVCNGKAKKGIKLSTAARLKMSLNHADISGDKNPFFGKKHTPETIGKIKKSKQGKNYVTEYMRQRSRERNLENVDKYGIYVFFNKNACAYFDDLSAKMNWNLQHALNGGEVRIIGYSIDAYDKDKNIIAEYDEPNHYGGIPRQLKKQDIIRQNRLIKHLNCQFFRYDEKLNLLYEVKYEENIKN